MIQMWRCENVEMPARLNRRVKMKAVGTLRRKRQTAGKCGGVKM
jgi:hypothetical protein